MSQPSTIILSMARFFLMFSVSETSSCIWRERSSSWTLACSSEFFSTWSGGVCASSSCRVMMYRGICEAREGEIIMDGVRGEKIDDPVSWI